MLLRRITEHVKTQNWFAVLVDFVIVVVGVFIGIQVSNWNESLAEREREAEFLERLAVDFDEIVERLTDSVTRYEQFTEATGNVYRIIASGVPPVDPDDFQADLRRVTQGRMPAWQSATFLEMQSSGNLVLLQDEKLKSALIRYEQRTLLARDAFGLLADRGLPSVQKILSVLRLEPDLNAETTSGSFRVASFDFERMLSDPEFLPSVNTMIAVHANNLSLQRQQLEYASEVVRMLKKHRRSK